MFFLKCCIKSFSLFSVIEISGREKNEKTLLIHSLSLRNVSPQGSGFVFSNCSRLFGKLEFFESATISSAFSPVFHLTFLGFVVLKQEERENFQHHM